jgi:LuxR family maltose regulon positive regulatory protein
MVEAGVLQALALDALGERLAAIKAFEEILLFAKPEGFTRIFLEEGDRAIWLLHQLRRKPSCRASVDRILRKPARDDQRMQPVFQEDEDGKQQLAGSARSERYKGMKSLTRAAKTARKPVMQDPLVEPLSERELEVLELIARGLPNQEIAEELVLAPSTVHWHTKKIYSKLHVHSRTQAILRARELAVLP